MPPRHGRGQVGQFRAKSTCIIRVRIPLEAFDEPVSGTTPTDGPHPRAFSASELVQCGSCTRANPPTRASCLYCGAALETTELHSSLAGAQKPETTSDVSFHLVAIAPVRIEQTALSDLAGLVNAKPSDLQLLLTHPAGAPVSSVNSETQAQMAAEKLREHGIRTQTISDKQLALKTAPVSVSALEISDDRVVGTLGRSNQTVAASWEEITLIVIGRLYFEVREIDQKRTRAQQVVDEREMLSDEAVLDIYTRGDDHGWRIRAGNFDFSCLGDQKKLTTFENFTTLTSRLREHASAAAFDELYVRLRGALNGVWPAESNAGAKERRRNAFGDFDASTTSIDNEGQFTRYSRLLRYLQASNSEDHAAQT
jgi:hypothetical protein